MSDTASELTGQTRDRWSTRKRYKAPRGVRKYPSGAWGIQWLCGCGKYHKERVGVLKEDAVRAYYERKKLADAGRCPITEQCSTTITSAP
jgi:hypothetical protein